MNARRMTPTLVLLLIIAATLIVSMTQIVIVTSDSARMQKIEEVVSHLMDARPGEAAEAQAARTHEEMRSVQATIAKDRREHGWLLLFETVTAMALTGAFGCALFAHQSHRRLARQITSAGEALARSEGTRTRFIEVIAHDLRQPIQTIELFSAGLMRRHLDPEAVPMLDGIRSSLASMRRMLSGLMDVSRLDAGAVAPEPEDIAIAMILAPIAAELGPVAEARGLAFGVFDGGAAAHTDAVILECVLRNLVSNAVRYTRTGSVTVSCSNADGRLLIVVSDTGPGIAEAELGRIFQEFYRVSSTAQSTDGLGLGLAIVRRMLQLVDIGLEVSSTVGQGTAFTVSVPIARGAIVAGGASEPESDDEAAMALAGARVLLIDDDENVRSGLGWELSARGIVMTAVASPAAACALFAQPNPPRFDVAIVDRDLGSHLTGPELLDHLAATFHIAIPALVLSGTQDFKVIAELQEAGYPWLSKPVNIEVLIRELGRLAASRSLLSSPI